MDPAVEENDVEVLIVGGGPAGAAAALQIAREDPALASRTRILDAEVFPREKLCGGGLVPESDRLLSHLDVSEGFSSVPIRRIVFEYPGGRSVRSAKQFFRVVHRREFDEVLLAAARKRGVAVDCGVRVQSLERDACGVIARTSDGGCLRARVVIGADGARSRVRKSLIGSVRGDRFVALEVLSRGYDLAGPLGGQTAVFDFRPTRDGTRGYAWDFPSLRDGEAWMNRGFGALAGSSPRSLSATFEESLRSRGLAASYDKIEAAGAPLYHPGRPQGGERVLLAGDAVGIDPWFGEGISVALGTGILAANAAMCGLVSDDLDFSEHAARIAESAVGWSLRRKRVIAQLFYAAGAVESGMAGFLGSGAPMPRDRVDGFELSEASP